MLDLLGVSFFLSVVVGVDRTKTVVRQQMTKFKRIWNKFRDAKHLEKIHTHFDKPGFLNWKTDFGFFFRKWKKAKTKEKIGNRLARNRKNTQKTKRNCMKIQLSSCRRMLCD